MRLLFTIKSCLLDLDRGFHDVIRNTWGQDIQEGTLRFFVGGPERTTLFNDEIQVDCDDSYHALPFKTREICRWFLKQQYDFAWIGDTDTLLSPRKLMKSNFWEYDYMGVNSRPWGVPFAYTSRDRDGKEHHHPKAYPWASGGFGYTLSRRAAEYIAVAEPTSWAEDMFVASVLSPVYNEGKLKFGNLQQGEVSLHFPQNRYHSGYDPRFGWMQEQYEGFK